MGMDKDVVAKMWDLIAPHLSKDGRFDPAALQGVGQFWVDLQYVKEIPDMHQIYTKEFLPK
jgi:hypothetical protein